MLYVLKKTINTVCIITSINFIFSNLTFADSDIDKDFIEFDITSPWKFDAGSRYWLGAGSYKKHLYGTVSNDKLSLLTYEDYLSNAGEGIWWLQHDNNMFIKGYFGGGSIANGHLLDEDFPPFTNPHSKTLSDFKNSALEYFSVDLGYNFINNENYTLGSFVGYHYWMEHYNTFGCQQLSSNQTICANVDSAIGIPSYIDVLNNNAVWNSLRIGINGSLDLAYNFSVNADIAYINSNLKAIDYHNLRSDIRGTLDDGRGQGVQIDALLNWKANPNLSFATGGRLWLIKTSGLSHFELTAAEANAQLSEIEHDNYGLLLQANYKFQDANARLAPVSLELPVWDGFYFGVNLGYGTNQNQMRVFPSDYIADGRNMGLILDDKGFIAGPVIGYNIAYNNLILGVEFDWDYADISSANATTINYTHFSADKKLKSFSTLRGKLGVIASNNMLGYVTAGGAFGGSEIGFGQHSMNDLYCYYAQCFSSKTFDAISGWSAGAGIEYAVSDHLRFKTEYLYTDLGSALKIVPSLSPIAYQTTNTDFIYNVLRFGINYKL